MALNFQGLKDDLLVAFTLGEEINPESEQALLDQVEQIARAIETYVKSGDIIGITTIVAGAATPALVVSGTGTQNNPVKIQ